jgi:hypothetical protein
MLFSPRLSRFDALLTELNDDNLCGTWDRKELEAMDLRFCEAVTAAFEARLESREAAKATIQVGRKQQTKEQAIEAAIQEGWLFFCRNRDDRDLPFSEIVAYVQAHNGGATVELIRAGFERRFKNGGNGHAA